MNAISKSKGFTLIELVIVIIILGILAVTAAPKFINLQKDARISTLQGLEGAIKGGASLVYSKAAIAGQEASSAATITLTTGDVNTAFGYPNSTDFDTGLANWLDISIASGADATSGDWDVEGTTISPAGYANAGTCNVEYSEAGSSGDSPDVVVTSTGC